MSAKEIEFLLAIETMPEAYQPEADHEGKPIPKIAQNNFVNLIREYNF